MYISLLVSVWRIIYEKFQPKWTHISWDMNENINKENKKNSGLEKRYSNALTPSWIIFSSDNFLQSFCTMLVSVTPSDNYFTISPHNSAPFALYPPTLLPSTFKEIWAYKKTMTFETESMNSLKINCVEYWIEIGFDSKVLQVYYIFIKWRKFKYTIWAENTVNAS